MKFCIDIHGPQKMNTNDSGDHLTFHLAPLSGQNCNLSNTLLYDQIPAKRMTSPSTCYPLLTSSLRTNNYNVTQVHKHVEHKKHTELVCLNLFILFNV